jgi:hypothetical protein
MQWHPDHNHVQKLALANTAATLSAAAACRHAAQLAHQHGTTVPDAAIAKAVEHFASLLRTAIGFTQERRYAAEPDE